jgi:primosomal protein N' (replication factor Y)
VSDSTVTYVDVILPLPLPQAYTYAVPVDWVEFVKVGQRVIVQFGKNKYYSAIVKRIHNEHPAVDAKLIESIAEEEPIVTETQMKFWEWMAGYYMCTEGEVMNAALPSGLKLSSETKIIYNESYEGEFDTLNDAEFVIVQALRAQGEMTLTKVQELLEKRNVYPLLKTLFNLGIAISAEEVIEKFKPKTETFVKLDDKYRDDDKMELLFEELQRAPKQIEILLAFIQLGKQHKYIKKTELLALSKADAGTLKRLVDKQIFIEFRIEVSRLGNFQTEEVETLGLSEEQQVALQQINEGFEKHNVVLLHGVTGSGKTLIYVEKINEAIQAGKQVLYLLPEIALTAQIINRLRKVFGNVVGVYHSKFNQNERVEIWNKVLHNQYKILIGARSGLLMPFHDLGLIIVDEEHDQSLKQMNPAPRYNARDSAIMLAHYFNAKVILGTATPSVETYFNTEKEKYALVTLSGRYGGVEMPEVVIADLKRERQQKKLKGSFSETLIDGIHTALQNKEQVILFLNRRGYANYQVCRTCNHVYRCVNCDVSLTYHKFQSKLVCHYCGYNEKTSHYCKSCGMPNLEIVGMGTEKIEDELDALFPSAKVARLDLDSTRAKHGHSTIISQFENREVDILVGTQMVSKGLDFDNVSLVGVISADQMLFHPGFRSFERAFQLILQVAGRAGRKSKKGKVIIQTSDPLHPIIQNVIAGDYMAMYKTELMSRRQFKYPPYNRLIEITLQHKKPEVVDKAALYLANQMRSSKTCLVLGPAIPVVSRINTYYQREVLLKTAPAFNDLNRIKQTLKETIDRIKISAEIKSVDITIDVDP